MRTSAILAVIAAVLLAYIVLVDRGSVSTGELEQRKGSALPEFVRARVAAIEVQHLGVTTRLTRNPELTDEGGLWRVEAPFKAMADSQLVDGLLSELEFLDARRRLEGLNADDRRRFGLEAPRYRLTVTLGKVRIRVAVGHDSPNRDGVYLQAGDPRIAFVVGKDLIETLDHDPTDYHTKELHDGLLVTTASAITLRDDRGERGAHRLDLSLWELDQPALGLASAPVIAEIVNAFDALRAKHFIADASKALAAYGLDQPRFELMLHKRAVGVGDAGAPKQADSSLRLRVGRACEGHPDESYLVVNDGGSVRCALDADLEKLRRPLGDLRELRLLPLDDDEVESVQLEQGKRRVVLRKAQDEWSYEVSGAAAGSPANGKARPNSVKEWLGALRAEQAERIEAGANGLGSPNLTTLRIERGGNKSPFTLRVDESRPDHARVQRGDDAQTLLFTPRVVELVEASAARFWPLTVLRLDQNNVRTIELHRGSLVERLQRSDAGAAFAIEAPLHTAADNLAANDLLQRLSSLDALRFATDEPLASQGLDHASIVVTLDAVGADGKVPAKHVELRIGNKTTDGAYAQLAGARGVFVVANDLVARLAEPFAARTLLATPIERIEAITVEHGTKRFTIARHGDGFSAVGGKPVEGATAAAALARSLATLRAHAISYGPAAPDQGLAAPWARIIVTERAAANAGATRYSIRVGSEAPNQARYARRDDAAVTFALSSESVDALVAPLDIH